MLDGGGINFDAIGAVYLLVLSAVVKLVGYNVIPIVSPVTKADRTPSSLVPSKELHQ